MLKGIVVVVECDREGCSESLSIVFEPIELPLGHFHLRSAIVKCGWYAVLRNPKTPWQWATYNLEEAKKLHAGNLDDLASSSSSYPLEYDKYYCCKECRVAYLIEGKLYKVTEKVAPQYFFVAPLLRGKLDGETPDQWRQWGREISGPYFLSPETGEEPLIDERSDS